MRVDYKFEHIEVLLLMEADDWEVSQAGKIREIWDLANYFYSTITDDKATIVYFSFLLLVLVLGLLGPIIAPYEHDTRVYGDDDQILFSAPPSMEHPLGTTDVGYDVLSRLLVGARPTVVTGLVGGTMIFVIGTTIGISAGYMGGYTETILMRLTDTFYGIPLIPFALIIAAIVGSGFWISILIIGFVLWRGLARVIRSQVLQIKQRPFMIAAQTSGASSTQIIIRHVLPNVAPMGILYFALGTGYTIVLQASLAFLGVTDPFLPSWGIMVRNAFSAGAMSSAWWWSLPPGFMISFIVLSLFMIGRKFEAKSEHIDDRAMVEAG